MPGMDGTTGRVDVDRGCMATGREEKGRGGRWGAGRWLWAGADGSALRLLCLFHCQSVCGDRDWMCRSSRNSGATSKATTSSEAEKSRVSIVVSSGSRGGRERGGTTVPLCRRWQQPATSDRQHPSQLSRGDRMRASPARPLAGDRSCACACAECPSGTASERRPFLHPKPTTASTHPLHCTPDSEAWMSHGEEEEGMEEWMMWSALRRCGGGDDHGQLAVEPESLSATAAAVVGFGHNARTAVDPVR